MIRKATVGLVTQIFDENGKLIRQDSATKRKRMPRHKPTKRLKPANEAEWVKFLKEERDKDKARANAKGMHLIDYLLREIY